MPINPVDMKKIKSDECISTTDFDDIAANLSTEETSPRLEVIEQFYFQKRRPTPVIIPPKRGKVHCLQPAQQAPANS